MAGWSWELEVEKSGGDIGMAHACILLVLVTPHARRAAPGGAEGGR